MIKKSLILLISSFIIFSTYSVQNKIEMNMKYIGAKIRVNNELKNTISLIQMADKCLDEGNNLLEKSREILVRGANGIYTIKDRRNMISEIIKNLDDYNFIIKSATFNNIFIFHDNKDKFNSFKVVYSEFENSDTIIFNSPNYNHGENIFKEIVENLKPTPESFKESIFKVDRIIPLINKERVILQSEQESIEFAIKFNQIFLENQYDKNKIIKKLIGEKEHFFIIEDKIYSLAVQGASGIYTNEDRVYLDINYHCLVKEFKREQELSGIIRKLTFSDSADLLTQQSAEKEMKRISSLL